MASSAVRVCVRKQRHTSYRKALAAAKSLYRCTSAVCQPYQCPHGNHWHIGHAMNPQAQQELEREFRG